MKPRRRLGEKNVIGARVTERRHALGMKQKELLSKLQVSGMDISPTGLSELEGQIRVVRDFEVVILADVLKTTVEFLLEGRR